jgi:hypothetical protein
MQIYHFPDESVYMCSDVKVAVSVVV